MILPINNMSPYLFKGHLIMRNFIFSKSYFKVTFSHMQWFKNRTGPSGQTCSTVNRRPFRSGSPPKIVLVVKSIKTDENRSKIGQNRKSVWFFENHFFFVFSFFFFHFLDAFLNFLYVFEPLNKFKNKNFLLLIFFIFMIILYYIL